MIRGSTAWLGSAHGEGLEAHPTIEVAEAERGTEAASIAVNAPPPGVSDRGPGSIPGGVSQPVCPTLMPIGNSLRPKTARIMANHQRKRSRNHLKVVSYSHSWRCREEFSLVSRGREAR